MKKISIEKSESVNTISGILVLIKLEWLIGATLFLDDFNQFTLIKLYIRSPNR